MKRIKQLGIGLLSLVFLFSLTACGENQTNKKDSESTKRTENHYPYRLVDSEGIEITIKKEPKKIVSLAPSVTETVFALGREDSLVGRTDYDDYPKEVKDIASVGSLTDPNVEKIVSLEPNLVIASTHFKEDVSKKLQDLKIPVAVFYDANAISGAYDTIIKVGEIVNEQKKAENIVQKMKDEMDKVASKVKDEKKPTVYYAVSFGKDGDFTATGDTFIAQMIDLAGGDNIAKDASDWQYSLEKIVEKDPEYILISKNNGMKDQLMASPGYQELSAVKNDQVIEVDDNLLNRQGPRLADGVKMLAKIFHPTKMK